MEDRYDSDMLLALLSAASASTLSVSLWDEDHPTAEAHWQTIERDRVILDTGETRLRVTVRRRADGGTSVKLSRCLILDGDRCRTWRRLEKLTFGVGQPESWSHLEDDYVCGNQETVDIVSRIQVEWLGGRPAPWPGMPTHTALPQ